MATHPAFVMILYYSQNYKCQTHDVIKSGTVCSEDHKCQHAVVNLVSVYVEKSAKANIFSRKQEC